MKRAIVSMAAIAFLSACGAKVDTSSPDKFSASIAKIEADLSPEKKAQFHDALVAIAFDSADPTNTMFSNAPSTSPIFAAAGDKIKGKSADEIIKLGYTTRIGLLDQELAKDAAAIQSAKAARQKVAAVFDNILIQNPRYYVDHSNEFMAQPTIAFRIENNSKVPVKHIYLHGTLASPGRSIPWVDEDINYEFEGGLEPGESQSLDLQPNAFSDWAPKDTFAGRDDLNLKLTLTNVEGANGEKLINEDAGDPASIQKDAAEKQALRNKLATEAEKL